MEDRTPTLERLVQLKQSLDTFVAFIYQEVPISLDTGLNKYAMIRVTEYMGINFSEERPDSFEGYARATNGMLKDVDDYDIGYRLIKDQLGRELQLLPDEKRILLDGVMGWLFYNPGTKHDGEMNKILKQYVEQFGIDRLNNNFKKVYERFQLLSRTADEAQTQLSKKHSHKSPELTYSTMFAQCFYTLDYRKKIISGLVDGFSPN